MTWITTDVHALADATFGPCDHENCSGPLPPPALGLKTPLSTTWMGGGRPSRWQK